MTDDERLYFAALSRASHGGEDPDLHRLRRFTHDAMTAGRIDGDTQDQIGKLLDTLSRKNRSKVDDVITANAKDIPWDVLEVRDDENTVWRRAFGDNRYFCDDDGLSDTQEYDWTTEGGRCTTEGLLFYVPLTVTKVAITPGSEVAS